MVKLRYAVTAMVCGLALASLAAQKGRQEVHGEQRLRLIAPVAEGVLRVRPTFNACGVCYGSAQALPGVVCEVRTVGGTWRAVERFPYFTETKDYRGSIVALTENTPYEVRLVQGGQTLAETSFRTWASEVPVARTVVLDPDALTYPCRIAEKGTPNGWIRYTAKKGSVFVNETREPAFVIDGAEHVLFEGITVKGGVGRTALDLKNSKAVRIRNCEFSQWGRRGRPRYDGLGRPFEDTVNGTGISRNAYGGYNAKGGINFDGAISIRAGCTETVVERCYIHDPGVAANSWYYSHPAGGEAIMLYSPDHSTVIRYNDFVGSDLHRFNDAVESAGNFKENGGLNRDADVYGNFMIFCNDDCIELDGGQQNVRCFQNRFESALCGVSIQGCMASPVYLWQNGFYGMCDEFGNAGQTIKTGGGPHGEEAYAYIWKNLFWGAGSGIICMERLRAQIADNDFCGKQAINKFACSPHSSNEVNRFRQTVDEGSLSTDLPVRPVGFTLDRARFSGIRLEKGRAVPETLTVTATSTSVRDIPFTVRVNEDFPWLEVTPSVGVLKAKGTQAFTVRFRTELMTDRHFYRGAFLVRTDEGLSRPVSVYAETDFVPSARPHKPEDVAVYVEAKGGATVKLSERNVWEFPFEVPKDGRYYLMVHAAAGRGGASLKILASLDDALFEESRHQLWPWPVWSIVAPGNSFGNTIRFWDFKAGEKHVLRLKGKARISLDGIVLTDNPGAFEPR